jgi:hypothetical protein
MDVKSGHQTLLISGAMLFALGALAVFSSWKTLGGSSSPAPEVRPLPVRADDLPLQDQQVYAAACDVVLGELKCPSTARFSPPMGVLIAHRPDDSWDVSGDVDSQNLYGAMVRSHWTVRMEYDSQAKRGVNITQCTVY